MENMQKYNFENYNEIKFSGLNVSSSEHLVCSSMETASVASTMITEVEESVFFKTVSQQSNENGNFIYQNNNKGLLGSIVSAEHLVCPSMETGMVAPTLSVEVGGSVFFKTVSHNVNNVNIEIINDEFDDEILNELFENKPYEYVYSAKLIGGADADSEEEEDSSNSESDSVEYETAHDSVSQDEEEDEDIILEEYEEENIPKDTEEIEMAKIMEELTYGDFENKAVDDILALIDYFPILMENDIISTLPRRDVSLPPNQSIANQLVRSTMIKQAQLHKKDKKDGEQVIDAKSRSQAIRDSLKIYEQIMKSFSFIDVNDETAQYFYAASHNFVPKTKDELIELRKNHISAKDIIQKVKSIAKDLEDIKCIKAIEKNTPLNTKLTDEEKLIAYYKSEQQKISKNSLGYKSMQDKIDTLMDIHNKKVLEKKDSEKKLVSNSDKLVQEEANKQDKSPDAIGLRVKKKNSSKNDKESKKLEGQEGVNNGAGTSRQVSKPPPIVVEEENKVSEFVKQMMSEKRATSRKQKDVKSLKSGKIDPNIKGIKDERHDRIELRKQQASRFKEKLNDDQIMESYGLDPKNEAHTKLYKRLTKADHVTFAKMADENRPDNEKSFKEPEAKKMIIKGAFGASKEPVALDLAKSGIKATAPKKFGEHSVHVNQVKTVELDFMSSDLHQNILIEMFKIVDATPGKTYWDDRNLGFGLRCEFVGPPRGANVNYAEFATRWDRFLDHQVEEIHISFIQPFAEGAMPKSSIADFMDHDSIRTRPTSDAILAPLDLDKRTSEALAGIFDRNLIRYDMTAIYVIGSLIAMTLSDYHEAHMVYRFMPAPLGCLTLTNMRQHNVEDMVKQFTDCMIRGDICLMYNHVSNVDIMVMMLISGGPAMVQPGGGRHHLYHVTSAIRTPLIRWQLMCPGERERPLIENVKSENVYAFMQNLAMTTNTQEHYVRGFIQACTIINGDSYAVGHRGANIYMTSLFEVEQMTWPEPRSHNPLWHHLNREEPRANYAIYSDDYSVLISVGERNLNRIGAGIATLMSLCMSHIFHYFNMTGRELNSYICTDVVDAPIQSRQWLYSMCKHPKQGINPLIAWTCNQVMALTGMVINHKVWGTRCWNNAYVDLPRDAEPNEYWQGVWGKNIPYMAEPMTIALFSDNWPSVYGISAPPVGFNFSQEILRMGSGGFLGWYADEGEKEYKERFVSDLFFTNVPYGSYAINAIRQHFGIRENWRIGFELYARVGTNRRLIANDIEDFQPVYDDNFGHIVPGSLVNYDWERGVQMIPVLYKEEIGNRNYELLTNVNVSDSDYAGMCLPRVMTSTFVPSVVQQLTQLGMFDRLTLESNTRAPDSRSSGNRSGPA